MDRLLHAAAFLLISLAASISLVEAKDACQPDNFDCAIELAHAQAMALATLPGDDGFEARFTLRERALDIVSQRKYPADARVAFLKAIVSVPKSGAAANEEVRGDLSLLTAAVKTFIDQGEPVAAFDVTDLAIRLVLLAPDSDLESRLSYVPGYPAVLDQRLSQLLALADAVRDAPSLTRFRQELVRTVARTTRVYDPNASREAVAARAAGLLELTTKLRDFQTLGDVAPSWYWQPILHSGVAQFLIGQTDVGREQIENALRIVHDIENPDDRLRQLSTALLLLFNMHGDGKGHFVRYDRDRLLSLMVEMKTLADSLNTPIALESRARVAQLRASLLAEPSK